MFKYGQQKTLEQTVTNKNITCNPIAKLLPHLETRLKVTLNNREGGTGSGLTGSRQHADGEVVSHRWAFQKTVLYLGDVDLPVAPLPEEDHHVRAGRGPLAARPFRGGTGGRTDGRAGDTTVGAGRAGRREAAPGQDRDRQPPPELAKAMPGHGLLDPADRELAAGHAVAGNGGGRRPSHVPRLGLSYLQATIVYKVM